MTNEIEQGLHEKLCAYVLGEASEAVRVEIEAALESSAELREERETLEKTIGLVRETIGGGSEPALSAEAILADARAARRRPWYSRPAFRAAAGIAAVSLMGVLAYKVKRSNDSRDAPKLAANFRELDESKLRKANPIELPARDDKNLPPAVVKSEAAAATAPPAEPAAPGAQPSLAAATPGERMIDSTLLGQLDQQAQGSAKKSDESFDRLQSNPPPMLLRSLGYTGAEGAGTAPTASSSPPSSRAAHAGKPGVARKSRAGTGPAATGSYQGPAAGSDNFFIASSAKSSGAKDLRDLGYTGGGGEESGALKGLGYVEDSDGVRGEDLSAIDQLRRLDPADRDRWIESECQRILRRCRRYPGEKPRDMFFRFYGDNPFEVTALDSQSTFSVDVDTASYTLARRYLNEGHLPEKAQIRTEEFVNYFKADVPHPTKDTFAIHTDLVPSRFSSDKARWMLRVVVSGKEVTKQDRKPLNLTFVIDVSGSMREQNRLDMVKHAIRLLVTELGGGDNIAIVVFSNDARTVLPMTSVRSRSEIESAIFPLQPESSTNSEAGLKLGYSIALSNLNPEANNRVVFLSDGVANVGETDPAKISEEVKSSREKGIYLNTIGVGMNNHNDVLLEQLADKSDGVCKYIDNPAEAKKFLVDEFTGTFETIARDAKIQVEFDPAQVERYRLLGYENRAIADKDFRNDKIDAGEVGAGHQVTALYELELGTGAAEKPLATVRLRWKAPRNVSAPTANEEATEISQPVLASSRTGFEGAGVGYRRAIVVAQFAEFLRRSVHARGESLDDLIGEAEKLEKETHDPETGELVLLLHKSKSLILAALPPCDDMCQAIESLRRRELLRCEHAQLETEQDKKLLADLEKQDAELEGRIRELLRRKIDAR